MKINYKNIKYVIKLLRINKQMSMNELATELGTHKTTIARLEKGEKIVSYKELNDYSSFFHVPIIYIICNEEINLDTTKNIKYIKEKERIFENQKLIMLDENKISKKIIEKYKTYLKDNKKTTLESKKIIEELAFNMFEESKGNIDIRRVTRRIKKEYIPFKYLDDFISVLDINIEEFFYIDIS